MLLNAVFLKENIDLVFEQPPGTDCLIIKVPLCILYICILKWEGVCFLARFGGISNLLIFQQQVTLSIESIDAT